MFEAWHLENMVNFHLASSLGCVHLDPAPSLEVRVLLFFQKDWGLSEHGLGTSQVITASLWQLIDDLSHHCDQTPDNGELQQGGFVLAHNLRGHSPFPWRGSHTGNQLSPLYVVASPQNGDPFTMGLPFSVKPFWRHRNGDPYPQVCFHGDYKSIQIDSGDELSQEVG